MSPWLKTTTVCLILSLLSVTACGNADKSTLPTPGSNGLITFTDVSDTSVVLNWSYASDPPIDPTRLAYKVYQSSFNNINTVADCQKNGMPLNLFELAGDTRISAGVAGLLANTTYYFNIVVKDSDGNISAYSANSVTTLTPDITPPAPGNSGAISASSISGGSLVLHWTGATDDRTPADNLGYTVYRSSSNNLNIVANCEANGTKLAENSTGSNVLYVKGLSASATYYFNIVVQDLSGNKSVYTTSPQTTSAIYDTSAPAVLDMQSSNETANSIKVSWSPATDNMTLPSDLQYALYTSNSSNLGTVADCENNGELLQDFTTNVTSLICYGLDPDTTYYFCVIVRDATGNMSCYPWIGDSTTSNPDPPLADPTDPSPSKL